MSKSGYSVSKGSTRSTRSSDISTVRTAVLQRQCACGQHKPAGAECEDCKEQRMSLRRKSDAQHRPSLVPPIVHQVLRSPGRQLETDTRSFFESRFGEDFSHVRVHTDERASDSAQAVNALAYTVGTDVVFDRGQYAPSTLSGRHLLAHELTHVVQQKGATSNIGLSLGKEGDSCEQEADRVARNVIQSGPANTVSGKAASIARTAAQGSSVVQRSVKGAFLGALGGGATGAFIGGLAGGLPGAVLGGLVGGGIGALIGALIGGSKVSVDKSCGSFCTSLSIDDEAKKTDSKASSGCKNVKFNYLVTGDPKTHTFDQKIDLNHVTVKCDASNGNCGGWSSKGVITLGKNACNAGVCGPLASSILHEMVHDWAGWGPPYDKKNVTVAGASHTTPDFLDEWIARYAEKSCFGYDPWGLP